MRQLLDLADRVPGGRGWLEAALLAGLLGACATDALAADPASMPIKAPANGSYQWDGFYFGGHVGYGRGTFDAELREPGLAASFRPDHNGFGSLYAGVH